MKLSVIPVQIVSENSNPSVISKNLVDHLNKLKLDDLQFFKKKDKLSDNEIILNNNECLLTIIPNTVKKIIIKNDEND